MSPRVSALGTNPPQECCAATLCSPMLPPQHLQRTAGRSLASCGSPCPKMTLYLPRRHYSQLKPDLDPQSEPCECTACRPAAARQALFTLQSGRLQQPKFGAGPLPAHRLPSGCSSPQALYLTFTLWPLPSATSISSSSSSGTRNARVGSTSVYRLYFSSHALQMAEHQDRVRDSR